jgi:anti-anti-sigma regulatory factor
MAPKNKIKAAGGARAAPRRSASAIAAPGASNTAGALPLGPSLSIREVGERAAQLNAMLSAGAAVVDARKLESVDTAGLQLLLATAAAARRRGLTLKLLGAASLQSGAAAALGLAEQLAETTEISP